MTLEAFPTKNGTEKRWVCVDPDCPNRRDKHTSQYRKTTNDLRSPAMKQFIQNCLNKAMKKEAVRKIQRTLQDWLCRNDESLKAYGGRTFSDGIQIVKDTEKEVITTTINLAWCEATQTPVVTGHKSVVQQKVQEGKLEDLYPELKGICLADVF